MTDHDRALIEEAIQGHASTRDAMAWLIHRVRSEEQGESNVLARLLREAEAILVTLDPEDSDELEKLADLRVAIIYALDPYKREGTLL